MKKVKLTNEEIIELCNTVLMILKTDNPFTLGTFIDCYKARPYLCDIFCRALILGNNVDLQEILWKSCNESHYSIVHNYIPEFTLKNAKQFQTISKVKTSLPWWPRDDFEHRIQFVEWIKAIYVKKNKSFQAKKHN